MNELIRAVMRLKAPVSVNQRQAKSVKCKTRVGHFECGTCSLHVTHGRDARVGTPRHEDPGSARSKKEKHP